MQYFVKVTVSCIVKICSFCKKRCLLFVTVDLSLKYDNVFMAFKQNLTLTPQARMEATMQHEITRLTSENLVSQIITAVIIVHVSFILTAFVSCRNMSAVICSYYSDELCPLTKIIVLVSSLVFLHLILHAIICYTVLKN